MAGYQLSCIAVAGSLALTQANCGLPAAVDELHAVAATYGGLQIEIEFDRPFASRDGATLYMDIFRPTAIEQPVAAVVLVHGGFWLFGERSDMHKWAADLAGQGYTAAAIDYRVIPQGGQYPAPVADVAMAVRHLRQHADELSIDPQRIALFGISAGAHLALLVALAGDAGKFDPTLPMNESTDIRAVVEMNGPTDFLVDLQTAAFWQGWLVACFLGGDRSELPQRWQEASPVTHVRADGPPVFILHGTQDSIVPIAQGRSLRDTLEAAGQPHEYFELPEEGHFPGSAWESDVIQQYREEIFRFLEDHLQEDP